MRWSAIVILGTATSTAVACPTFDFSVVEVGGSLVERRQATYRDDSIEWTVHRIPSRPQFYFHPAYGDPLPRFHRDDGTTIPFAVAPTGIPEFPLVLTVAIERGKIAHADYAGDRIAGETVRFIVDDDFVPATRGARIASHWDADYWHWSIDSDAALFRIETDGDVWYTASRDPILGLGDSLTAIYPDGREERLVDGWRAPTPAPPRWWLAVAVFAILGPLAWLARRAARSVVAEV